MDVSQCLDGLNSAEPGRRREAAEQLSREPDLAAAVSLVRACGDGDEQVRAWASSALEQMGAPDPADAGALQTLLADSRADVRYWSATLLGRLESRAASAVGSLIQVLDTDSAPAVRQRAAWALGRIGRGAKAACDSLARAASSGDVRLARLAAEALRNLSQ